LQRYGFFYVRGHGGNDTSSKAATHDSTLFDDIMRPVFAMSSEEKSALSSRGTTNRGYLGLGKESGSAANIEVKEAWSLSYEEAQDDEEEEHDDETQQQQQQQQAEQDETNAMKAPNVWPAETPSWKAPLIAYFNGITRVARQLTSGLAFALGYADDAALLEQCARGHEISLLRLFHYWPYTEYKGASKLKRTGSSEHTDWGFLTIIQQDQQSSTGLEMHRGGNDWVPVPSVAGTLLVNGGDYLSLISRGSFISPLHRVVSGTAERLSAVYFWYPNAESRIEMPSNAQQRYSLFDNQHEHAADAADTNLPFGDCGKVATGGTQIILSLDIIQ
jgi:isopenicillin N synthase-like dioxygenase